MAAVDVVAGIHAGMVLEQCERAEAVVNPGFAALCAVAEAGLEIYEIAPRKVKQAIAGYGAAHKPAVARMVQHILRLAQPPEFDAADALALALAHAQENGRYFLTAPRKV